MNINRRDFIRQTGVLLSASMVTAQFATAAEAKRYKMGLQLFTVRRPMAADAAGTLKTISNIGYEDLETYGFDPGQVRFYGFPAADFNN